MILLGLPLENEVVFRGQSDVRCHEAFNQNSFFLLDRRPTPTNSPRSTRSGPTARRYASPHTGPARTQPSCRPPHLHSSRFVTRRRRLPTGPALVPALCASAKHAHYKPLDFPHTRACVRAPAPSNPYRQLPPAYSEIPSHTRVCARASSLQPIPPAPSCLLLDCVPYATTIAFPHTRFVPHDARTRPTPTCQPDRPCLRAHTALRARPSSCQVHSYPYLALLLSSPRVLDIVLKQPGTKGSVLVMWQPLFPRSLQLPPAHTALLVPPPSLYLHRPHMTPLSRHLHHPTQSHSYLTLTAILLP